MTDKSPLSNKQIDNLKLTKHAFQRMKERIPDKAQNENSASKYIKHMIKESEYIGMISSDDRIEENHMFSYNNNYVIMVSSDLISIITIFVAEERNPAFIYFRNEIESIYRKEFRKKDREVQSYIKKLNDIKVKNKMEISILRYKIYKSRSDNAKKQYENMIKNYENEINKVETKLLSLQKDKKVIAFAIATKKY